MAYYPLDIREEELKLHVGEDFFSAYDTSAILGNIDFCVAVKKEASPLYLQSFLWAEAKKGNKHDIYALITQLVLTIGKAKTFDNYLPPTYLGAFDAGTIAFTPYGTVEDIFDMNDFNWNVTPSDTETKEFQLVYAKVKKQLEATPEFRFDFEKQEKELRRFIKSNFKISSDGTQKISINKHNYKIIYRRWCESVKDTIKTEVGWDVLKQNGILPADFFLADLLSDKDFTIVKDIYVKLKKDHYEMTAKTGLGKATVTAEFADKQVAYKQFWAIYKRPPKKEYSAFIVKRRDLLVPQDIRERKGSYFTPAKWVQLSQRYLENYFGENWQEEYYIWDCCAGTGNLEAGLYNRYNVWASTLDQPDVDVMRERVLNGAALLDSHVFQFDFLNDDLHSNKIPDSLKQILEDPEKRKKLIIYINPPYAEAGNSKTSAGTGQHKAGVATTNTTYEKYKNVIGKARQELFAQFLIRIFYEIPGCYITHFSKLKVLQAINFAEFRTAFHAKLESLFVVPADTFDNVKGQFPIGFHIWNTQQNARLSISIADVYNRDGILLSPKKIYTPSLQDVVIVDWLRNYKDKNKKTFVIGEMNSGRNDFQQTKVNYIQNRIADVSHKFVISHRNLLISTLFYAIRHCIPATWLNDRDIFFMPSIDTWQHDTEFLSDCFVYSIFNVDDVREPDGTNHWIPFKEDEIDANERFKSHFMTDFMSGKLATKEGAFTSDRLDMDYSKVESNFVPDKPMVFSAEALAVLEVGKELWKYYNTFPDADVNACIIDIKVYFQGRSDKGRINNNSGDEHYNKLMSDLRAAQKLLAEKIAPKVYQYGFLKE